MASDLHPAVRHVLRQSGLDWTLSDDGTVVRFHHRGVRNIIHVDALEHEIRSRGCCVATQYVLEMHESHRIRRWLGRNFRPYRGPSIPKDNGPQTPPKAKEAPATQPLPPPKRRKKKIKKTPKPTGPMAVMWEKQGDKP